MEKWVKDLMLLGLGVTSVTKEAVEKKLEELKGKGIIQEEEARALLEDILAKTKEREKELKTRIEKLVKEQYAKMIKESPFVLKKDYRLLEARVARLEKKLKKVK